MKQELRYSLMAVFIAMSGSLGSSIAMAGDDRHDSHGSGNQATGLVKEVRDATRRFLDVTIATGEGYGPFLGCVSGPNVGAMGIHFVNGPLVEDGLLDAGQPEVLVYEPGKNGRLRFVAVEYLIIAEAWHADPAHTAAPVLSGQVFNYVDSPNRYGLPAFYELHVWAWKNNPLGTFADWNSKVSCKDYAPEL
ncbi:MAG: hypothetical protein ACREQ8_08935 [Woeseiaceae bacterium]